MYKIIFWGTGELANKLFRLIDDEIMLVVDNDERDIKKIVEELGYDTETSEGYMVYITEQFWEKEIICPKLVKGLIRGRKR